MFLALLQAADGSLVKLLKTIFATHVSGGRIMLFSGLEKDKKKIKRSTKRLKVVEEQLSSLFFLSFSNLTFSWSLQKNSNERLHFLFLIVISDCNMHTSSRREHCTTTTKTNKTDQLHKTDTVQKSKRKISRAFHIQLS